MKNRNKGFAEFFRRFGVFALAMMLFAMPVMADAGVSEKAAKPTSNQIGDFGDPTYVPLPSSGSTLEKGDHFEIRLHPNEQYTDGDILFDTDAMYYQLPTEGLSYALITPEGGQLTINIFVASKGEYFALNGNVQVTADKKIVVTWDKNSPGYPYLSQVSNAEYDLGVRAEVDGSGDVIDLGDDGKYYVDNTGFANFTKDINLEGRTDAETAEIINALSQTDKAQFVFHAEIKQANRKADDTLERDADGHIIYEEKDVHFTLNDMTYDPGSKIWTYTLDDIEPGTKVSVREDARHNFPGYTYNGKDFETAETKGIAACTGETCSLVNNYVQNKGNLTIEKKFAADSDLQGYTEAQDGKIKVTVTGYADSDPQKKNPLTYSFTFEDKAQPYSHTFTDIPAGDYTVKEEATVDGYTWILAQYQIGSGSVTDGAITGGSMSTGTGAVAVDKDGTHTVKLTNGYSRNLGSLTLKKNFAGKTLTDAQKNAVTFTLKSGNQYVWLEKDGQSYKFAGLSSSATSRPSGAPNGAFCSFGYDKVGSSGINMTGLPTGTYTVVESNSDFSGLTCTTQYRIGSGNYNNVGDGNAFNVSVSNNTNTQAELMNTYAENGKLTVKKYVSGKTLSDNERKAIKFKLERWDESKWVEVGTKSLYDFGSDNEYTITGLPFGRYRVTESGAGVDSGKYSVETTYVVTQYSGTSHGAGTKQTGSQTDITVSNPYANATNNSNEVKTARVDFTNAYTRMTTELDITKTFGAYPADKTALESSIKFTVKQGGKTVKWTKNENKKEYQYNENGKESTISYEDIVKNGYKMTGVPVGVEYTVSESGATLTGYQLTTTINPTGGKITPQQGVSGTISFHNEYTPIGTLKITKDFTGLLHDNYCNAQIRPDLKFKVWYMEGNQEKYLNGGEGYTYSELASGVSVTGDRVYYVQEENADPDGNLKDAFTITTSNNGETTADNGRTGSVTVNPGDTKTISFTNDYRLAGGDIIPQGFTKIYNHKTWTGLDNGPSNNSEGNTARANVRFKLERRESSEDSYYTWGEYKWEDFIDHDEDGSPFFLLPFGDYRLTETNAAMDGYKHMATVQILRDSGSTIVSLKELTSSGVTFTLPEKASVEISLANVYEPLGDLQVAKVIDPDGNLTNLTNEQKQQVRFTVYRRHTENGASTDVKVAGPFTLASDGWNNGVYTVSDLPVGYYNKENGEYSLVRYEYVVKEENGIDGYNCATTVNVNKTHGSANDTQNSAADEQTVPFGAVNLGNGSSDPAKLTFTNKYIRQSGALTISKAFEGELPQAQQNAVTFSVRDAQGKTVAWNNDGSSHIYSATGSVTSFTYAQMQSGSYTISGLPTGEYTIVETGSDAQTYIRTTTFVVTSGSGSPVTTKTMEGGVRPNGVTEDASSRVTIGNAGSSSVQITNSYTKVGSLKLTKTFAFAGDSSLSEAKMKAMVFKVKKVKADGTAGDVVAQINLSQAAWNGNTCEYTFENLPVGKYIIEESSADHTGFKRTTVVTVDGKSTTTTNSELNGDGGTPSAELEIEHNQTQAADITNTYEESGSLKIRKSYSGLGETPVQWDKIYFVVKNKDGVILPDNDGQYVYIGGQPVGTVSGLSLQGGQYTLNGLAAGEYTVTEVVLGESNSVADTGSTYYGYVHASTTVQVGNGAAVTTNHGVNIDDVSASGRLTANGVEFAFANTYQSVPKITAAKSDDVYPQASTEGGLPLWRFDITINGLSTSNTLNGQFSVMDRFDTDHPQMFAICTEEGYAPVATGTTLYNTRETEGGALFILGVDENTADQVTITYYLQPMNEYAFRAMLADEVTPKKSSISGTTKTWHFINTISYYPIPPKTNAEGDPLTDPVSVSTDYYYQLSPINKSMTSQDGSTKVTFTLVINEEGAMIGDGGKLTIYDNMSANVEVDLTTFTVEPESAKKDVKPTLLPDSADGRKNMSIEIPNGTPLTITYQGTITEAGTVNVDNKVSFLGVEDEAEDEITVSNVGSGSASLPCIRLHKYGHTELMALPGAKFDLFEVTDEHGSAVYVDTFETDENGKIVLESQIDWEILYYFQESEAPEGYQLDDSKIYFRVYDPYDEAHNATSQLEYAYRFGHTLMHNNEPAATQVNLAALKTITGKALEADAFIFDLYDGAELLQSRKNDAAGNVVFDPIPFSYNDLRKADGTYETELVKTYTIKEQIPASPQGVAYDEAVYTAKVTLTLDSEQEVPTLVAEVVYSDAAGNPIQIPTFANSYAASGVIKPAGEKTLLGADAMHGEFSFVISGAGEDCFAELGEATGNKAGILYPQFKYEVNPNAETEGYTYADGVITLTVKDAKNFENFDTDAAAPESGYDYAFRYTIKEVIPEDVGDYAYDDGEYVYVVSVKDNGDGQLAVSGKLTKDSAAANAASFENTYYGELMIRKTVLLGGKETTSTLLDGTYSFVVYTDEACTLPATDRDGKEVSAQITIANGASSTATISGLFPRDYWVKEIVAEDAISMPVTNPVKVTVAGSQTTTVPTAEFFNECGVGELELIKTVSGTENTTVDFTFVITVEGAAGQSYPARYSAAGADTTVAFDSEGKLTVKLKADESILIKNLPHGAAYDVKEIDIPEGYTPDMENAGGTISAAQKITLTQNNVYAAKGTASVQAMKRVTGNDYAGNEAFTFVLAVAEGENHPQGAQVLPENLAQQVIDGSIASWEIAYTQPGVYRYTIIETKPEELTAGMEYDETVHSVEVRVTDNGDGTMSSSVTYANATDEGLVINNRYSMTTFQPEVKKILTGERAPLDELFSFTLTGTAADGSSYTDEASCKAGETVKFDAITYHAPGTYVYTITENVPADPTPGMTYSAQQITCTVVVSRDAQTGELTTTAHYVGGGDLGNAFTNTFVLPKGEVQLGVTKAMTGNAYDGNEEFAFTLEKLEENPTSNTNNVIAQQQTQNVKAGSSASWTISYDEPGTYYYTITEAAGETAGMHYDIATYYAKVVVEYDGDALKATATYGQSETEANDPSLTVTNRYAKTTFRPEVKKVVDGENAPDETFTFMLVTQDENKEIYTEEKTGKANDTVQFSEFTYYTAGLYEYYIFEIQPEPKTPGMTYGQRPIRCKVTVSEDENGALSAAAVYTGGDGDQKNTFTNTYSKPVGDVELSVTKALRGNDYLQDNAFTFTLTKLDHALDSDTNNVIDPDTLTQQIKYGENTSWTISYDEPGTYYYTIAEAKGSEAGMHYDTATYYAKVVVEYDGDALKATATYGTSQNAVDPSLTVTNRYAVTTFQPEVKKAVAGEHAPDETFTFTLTGTGADGRTASCKDGETVKFDAITYYAPGKYVYTITENVPANRTPGMTYSAQKITCTVTVSEDEDGALSAAAVYTGGDGEAQDTITNTYERPKGEAVLGVAKAMTGNTYNGSEKFAFTLDKAPNDLDSDTNNVTTDALSKEIAVNGSASWTIKYDQPGTYAYTIQETQGNTAGMEYDIHAYEVIVEVSRTNDLMDLVADVVYRVGENDESSLTVTNKYSEISVQPKVKKVVEGKHAPDETFSFTLTGMDETVRTASCKAGGTAAFDAITYYAPGTYVYTITENVPDDPTPGMIYSEQEITYTVVIDRNKTTGELTITSETYSGGSENAPDTFTNTYVKPTVKTDLGVTKRVTGNAHDASELYQFTLTAVQNDLTSATNNVVTGDLKQRIAEDASAKWTIEYDQPGTYAYTIQETQGNTVGMEYDVHAYAVRVEVTRTDDLMGLETEVTYLTADEMPVEDLTVTNRYSGIAFQPEVKKVVEGKNAPDETFTFRLEELNGNDDAIFIEEKTGKDGDTVLFSALTYNEAGKHTYRITEIAPDDLTPGMTYFADSVICTVTVDRAEDGTLSVTEAYDGGNGETANTIKNLYAKPTTEAGIKVTKKLAGNDYDASELYAFTLTAAQNDLTSSTNNVVTGALQQQIAENASAEWTIAYDEPGTYLYTIVESAGSTTGMDYDTAPYYVKIVTAYTQDLMGMTAEVTYGGDLQHMVQMPDGLTVTNKYSEITVNPHVGKAVLMLVDGEPAPEKETFSFTLKGIGAVGSYTDEAGCEVGGTAAFDAITYYAPGTYVYTITENEPALEDRTPGMTYSKQEITYTVVIVRDEATGVLTIDSETYTGGDGDEGSTITNTYERPKGKAELEVAKAMTGNAYDGKDAFTFTLTAKENNLTSSTNNVIDPATLTQTIATGEKAAWTAAYDTEGTYTYTIQEIVPDETEEGMEYDVRAYEVQVKVEYSKDLMGLDTQVIYVTADGANAEDLTVTNRYSRISFQPEVKKVVEGENAPDETFTFYLEEMDENDVVLFAEEKTGKADDTVLFSAFTYYEAGKHTYRITEIAPDDLTPGMTYFADSVICTVTVDRAEDGTLSVTEVYEGGNGETANTIKNLYAKPKTEAEITVTKAITGNTYEGEDKFDFVLTQLTAQNNYLTSEPEFPIKVGETAIWKFAYDLPGTYYYMINEKDLGEAGVAYDPLSYLVKVETAYTPDLMGMTAVVTYGTSPMDLEELEEGLTVTNKYSKITFQPVIAKTVRVLVDGEAAPEGEIFNFTLTNGTDYMSTAACVDGGKAEFAEIVHYAPGTYVYTITENEPALEDRTPGMDYSDQIITYTVVVVRDEATGELTIQSETYTGGDGDEGSTITNTYEKPKGEAQLEALKAMTGSEYDGENAFTFKLTKYEPGADEEGGEAEAAPALTNNIIVSEAEQTIGVDEAAVWQILYSELGTYTYEITEIAGEEPGVIYNTNKYYAKVVVEYAEDLMSLVTTVTYGADPEVIEEETLTITNEYIIVEYVPEVKKVLLGKHAPDETFNFELTDGAGYTDTASCRGGEIAQFNPITYYEAGEYVYTIRELRPERPIEGMRYSREVITLTVTVTRNPEDNSLEIADAFYTLEGTITNTYEKPDKGYDFKFSFTKKWDGSVGEGIEWTLYDADGNVVSKMFNKTVLSENEWYYEAWFAADKGYYLVENVPDGYSPIYVNVGEHADVTDRLYNGGTLINYSLPKTGDESNMHGWLAALALSVIGLTGIAVRTAKRRKEQ